jgi:integrase
MSDTQNKPRKDRKVRGLYLRDKIWYIRIYHKGIDWRFSTGMESKKAATRELARAKSDKASYIAEKLAEKDRSQQLLISWIDEYLEIVQKNGRRDMRRRSQCVRDFCKRFPTKRISEITRKDIEIWREELRDRMAPASVNRHLAYGSHLMSEAIRRGYIQSNPFKGVERLREPTGRVRYLELEEAGRLVEACDGWFKPFLTLAFETGCRKSELVNLLWKDVDFRSGFLNVRLSKNGDSRMVPLTPGATDALKSIPRRLNHPYVFSGRTGASLALMWEEKKGRNGMPLPGLSYNNRPLHTALQKACKEAKILDFKFHDTRHHAASWMAMRGVSMDARMAILGHKTERMARRYSHLSPDYLKHAMALFSGQSGTNSGTGNMVAGE